jgi:hypothetical protein
MQLQFTKRFGLRMDEAYVRWMLFWGHKSESSIPKYKKCPCLVVILNVTAEMVTAEMVTVEMLCVPFNSF